MIFKNNIICDYIKELSSYSTVYRREHPKFREKEKIINNEQEKARYNNDPEYLKRAKQRALARHHKLKETKDNACISVNQFFPSINSQKIDIRIRHNKYSQKKILY